MIKTRKPTAMQDHRTEAAVAMAAAEEETKQ
jgi:hypothetical protein